MSTGTAIEYTERGSFAAEIETERYFESGGDVGADFGVRFSEGYNPVFNVDAPDMGFLEALTDRAVLGNTANQFQINPENLQAQPNIMEAPALAAGAIAAAAREAKVEGNINFGQRFDVSQKADATKFFKGQGAAEQRNDVKLEQTTQSVEVLAGAHQKLAGAEREMRNSVIQNPSGAASSPQASTQGEMNASDPVNKSASGGLVKSMLLGTAATSVASFLAPGAVPFVKAAAAIGTANAAGQSAALLFGGSGSQSYDRPRSKAEAREMRDPAASGSSPASANYFDNTTSGAMIMPPSAVNKSFNQAANETSAPAASDPRLMQIAELQKAQGEIWKSGEMQTGQMKDAEVAAESHENWRESGMSRYGLNEIARAAEGDAFQGSDDYLAALSKIQDVTQISVMQERGVLPTPDNFDFAPPTGMKMG